ncbi:MAG: hypothetical protein AB7H97_19660 [Pseudobdellovibrionaceae bacterium]
MRRFITKTFRRIAFLFKGLAYLPSYFRYWGLRKGLKRMVRALTLPAIESMMREFLDFEELRKTVLKPSRTPDYIVYAPDFLGNSAGIACLYQLCCDLRKLGFEAAVTGSQRGHPGHPVPIISAGEATRAAKLGAWVIYPEIVLGNPLKAKNVVRWILNRPGLLGGTEFFAPSEHVFIYSDVFAPYVKSPIRGKIYVPTIDRSIFFRPEQNEGRSLVCYYTGKSRYKEGYFDPKLTLKITRTSPAKTELGKLFRSAKVLYCFDNSTALIYEALLCGCPVIVIPDGTQTWEDYQKLELGTAGISWGVPKGSLEPFSPTELEQVLAKWEREYDDQIRFLAKYTQGVFPTPFAQESGQLSIKASEASSPSL